MKQNEIERAANTLLFTAQANIETVSVVWIDNVIYFLLNIILYLRASAAMSGDGSNVG